jgi:hypothetical protein
MVLVGCAMVAAGLYQPFYRLELPPGFVQQLQSGLASAGSDPLSTVMGQLLGQVAAQLDAQGGMSVDAWTAFERIDIAIALGAGLAVALVVLGALGHVSGSLLRAVWVIGLGIVALTGYRIAAQPGAVAEWLSIGRGAWILLAGGIVVAVGGWLAAPDDD